MKTVTKISRQMVDVASRFESRKDAAKERGGKVGNGMPSVCISYLRYSSAAQHCNDSIRRQLKASEDWAAAHKMVIDETLKDEGVSAFRGMNSETGALGSILRRIESNEIREGSVLIVESLDRLSRQHVRTALRQFLSIIDAGVTIVTLSDNREYSPEKCDELELIQSLMIMSRAHEESAMKSYRSKANWERRRAEAKSGGILSRRLPSWLVLNNGKIEIDKSKAATVRYIFDLALKGNGIGSIVKQLNAEKIAPVAEGKQWHSRFVWRLFNEEAVVGTKTLKRFEGKRRVVADKVEGYFPSVISREVFDKVHSMVVQRRSRKYGGRVAAIPNVFRDLLKDELGNSYTAFNRKRGGSSWRYMVSLSAFSKRVAAWHYLRADVFETAFFSILVSNNGAAFLNSGTKVSNTHILTAELDGVEKQIADMEDALANCKIAPASAIRSMEKLEARRNALAEQLDAARTAENVSDDGKRAASISRLAKLIGRGEMTNEERLEIGAILRTIAKGVTLKLTTAEGRMIGNCEVETRAGGSFSFRFSYSNIRNREDKAASLQIEPPNNLAWAATVTPSTVKRWKAA